MYFFRNRVFLLHRPIDDQKGLKNDPKMDQKVIQNRSKNDVQKKLSKGHQK